MWVRHVLRNVCSMLFPTINHTQVLKQTKAVRHNRTARAGWVQTVGVNVELLLIFPEIIPRNSKTEFIGSLEITKLDSQGPY